MAPSVYRDLSGCVFGRWTVTSRAPNSSAQKSQWNCICACGSSGIVLGSDLRQGKSRSCGCLRDETTAQRRLVDLTDRTFGRLHVLTRAPDKARGRPRWECRCECGTTTIVSSGELLGGQTRSCGCQRTELTATHRVKRDLRGQRFGNLVVLDDEPQSRELPGARKVFWHCRCDCGNDVWVQRGNLMGGHTVSCGCRKSELIAEQLITHGHSRRGAVSSEYRTWQNMLARCYNPASSYYHCYGARGISVCERWRASFESFLSDVGPRPSPKHSLGRKDNDGSYSPDNCRWETADQQASNTRANRWITYNGKTQTLSQWARETGISASKIVQRLDYYGWSIKDALTIHKGNRWDRKHYR